MKQFYYIKKSIKLSIKINKTIMNILRNIETLTVDMIRHSLLLNI